MSRLIDTEIGQFRAVQDGAINRYLFECPHCAEMLPLSDDALNGTAPIDHESRKQVGRFCTFSGVREFGRCLVSTMQAMIVMGYQPYHDEGETRWVPSRRLGVDGPI